MSRFFRSGSNSDSDSDSPGDSEHLSGDESNHGSAEDAVDALAQIDSVEATVDRSAVLAISHRTTHSNDRRDVLLHALLEEKCFNDVRNLLPDAAEAVIRRKAQERYRALSARLGHVGLAAPGLDDDAHMDIRMQYRRGLGLLADNVAVQSMSNGLRPSAQRLLTGNDTQYDMQQLQLPQHVPTIPPALGHLVPQRLFFGPSRYREELSLIHI